LVPSNLYSNNQDGKIIMKNNSSLYENCTCTYTSIISIKDNKLLLEFINIGYQKYYAGSYSGDQGIPEISENYNINNVYQIILKKPSEWKSNLILLKRINELFNSESESLFDYIVNYESTYKF
jgi:hypothetical protein